MVNEDGDFWVHGVYRKAHRAKTLRHRNQSKQCTKRKKPYPIETRAVLTNTTMQNERDDEN